MNAMIEEACAMIERVEERERRSREVKYGRRNRIRYIDQLLNELEMLNLADEPRVPERLAIELDRIMVESRALEPARPPVPENVSEAMDVLYEIQDSLMFNEGEEE
jgi:hypothetical protein